MLLHCPDLDHTRQSIDYEDIETNLYDENEKLNLTKFTKLVKKSGLFK